MLIFSFHEMPERQNFHNLRSKRSDDLREITANKPLPERQNKVSISSAFQAVTDYDFVSTGNAALACGYENFAFQAFKQKIKSFETNHPT